MDTTGYFSGPSVFQKPLLSHLGCQKLMPLSGYLEQRLDKIKRIRAKQPQFPQLFFIGLVFQALHQPCCPPLDVFKHLNVLPKLRGPELDTVLEEQLHQCQVQRKNYFPGPAGHTIPDTGQDAIVPLGSLGTLLAHVQSAVDQYPQVPFCLATVQPLCLHPAVLQGVIVAKVQNLALGLVKLHVVGLGPSIQPIYTEVAIMHGRSHQKGKTTPDLGNRFADRTAKGVAGIGILALVPQKETDLSEFTPKYNH
ncbi:hypothetical protein HGM15179_018349 [Zosterops borbonicus]|uniref:Uncharacterized protein n=1 Tax=Zosterops borbonicus TaxID=364589 RepID=A0A8K1FZ70_9PASS|nr:hypothetical protein HGM15179_018349 [Zosterops borbonicus]